jgi:hypothetical protein
MVLLRTEVPIVCRIALVRGLLDANEAKAVGKLQRSGFVFLRIGTLKQLEGKSTQECLCSHRSPDRDKSASVEDFALSHSKRRAISRRVHSDWSQAQSRSDLGGLLAVESSRTGTALQVMDYATTSPDLPVGTLDPTAKFGKVPGCP